MSDSSNQGSISRSIWRTVQIAGVLLLGGVILFFALTRTQVGRNQIRNQLETSFNEHFHGSLSIGSLEGTLIDDLVATDVQLRDSSGRTVVSVDSMVAIPRWKTLLTSELSVQSLTVIRPHLSPHRDSTGSWNLSRALHRTDPSSEEGMPLDLSLAQVEIRGGHVRTTRAGPAPAAVESDWLFDYTESEVDHVSVNASIERTSSTSRVEIREGTLALPEPGIAVSSFSGNVRQEGREWLVDEVDVSLDTTHLRLDASMQLPDSAGAAPSFEVDLGPTRLGAGDLRPLVPRLPLDDIVTLEGHIAGTTEQMDVRELTIMHDASFATVEGSVARGARPVELDLSLSKSRVSAEDVREVWPGLPPLPDRSLAAVRAEGSIEGTISPQSAAPAFDLRGTLQAESRHGTVRGSLALARDNAPLTYTGSITTDSLNLAPFAERTDLASRLNGTVDFEGQRGSYGLFSEGTVQFSLNSSRIAQRDIASANGELQVAEGRAQGEFLFQQPSGGRLNLKGRADRLGEHPQYSAIASATNLNVAVDGDPVPPTRLNGRLTLQGTGVQWQDVVGTAVVDIDSSQVFRNNEPVSLPPHSATIRLTDRASDAPRVEVSGTVASLTLDGSTLGPPLWSAGHAWSDTLADAAARMLDKPAPLLRTDPAEPPIIPPLTDTETFPLEEAPLFPPLETKPSSTVEADARLLVHQPDVLHAWWPAFPDSTTGFEANTTVSFRPDSVHISGNISAAGLRYGAAEATDLSIAYNFSSTAGAPLAESSQASFDISAREMNVRGVAVSGAAASLWYEGRSGTVRVKSDSMGIIGPTQLTAAINVTPTRNEFQIQQAMTTLQGQTWESDSPASVAVYSDMLAVSPLTVTRRHPQTSSVQSVSIGGRYSSFPTDTLSITAENVYLPTLSRALEAPNLIGGEASGDIHLRGGQNAPVVDSDFEIRHLSYDRRVLGTLDLQASYSNRSPDLHLNASLVSDTTTVDSLQGPDHVPGGARTVEPNDLTLSGHIRLPEWAPTVSTAEASRIPPGESLDFDVDIDRADLFFFRYIFEERVANVRGYTAGNVHVGGHFTNPLFDADLSIANGAVDLPRFGLGYRVDGPVEVDREGIHLQDLSVRDDDGRATVRGSILFNEYRYFSFNLTGTMDGITVMDVSEAEDLPFYGHIRASGPVSLTGPLPDATLRSNSAETTPDSELYIPVSDEAVEDATGFIVFADSTGRVPDLESITRRENILSDRPEGEPTFVEGLNIDINVVAPEGSTVSLVFDPVVGDMVTAVGSGRVQLQRQEGDFRVYGDFNATSGTYLFTAGEVFVRRFSIREGTITWDGDPINARLDLAAEYRTRASTSGLPGYENHRGRIPVTVQLGISGRVSTPQVDLNLALTRNEENNLVGTETLDAILNQPALRTEYATSVLLTNTFLLTTESFMQQGGTQSGADDSRITDAGNQLAFNSVSQLVSSQLNRYLGAALPNVDLNFGVQGEDPNDLDLIYGVALRLLNERLVIRGEGVYTGDESEAQQVQGPQGEFVVEVRLSSTVSAKAFYRRTGDELTRNRTLTSSTGAGLSFQTVFSTWSDLFTNLFGWLLPNSESPEEDEEQPDPVAVQPTARSDSTAGDDGP